MTNAIYQEQCKLVLGLGFLMLNNGANTSKMTSANVIKWHFAIHLNNHFCSERRTSTNAYLTRSATKQLCPRIFSANFHRVSLINPEHSFLVSKRGVSKSGSKCGRQIAIRFENNSNKPNLHTMCLCTKR